MSESSLSLPRRRPRGWSWMWERQDGRVFRGVRPEPTWDAAFRMECESERAHHLPHVGGVHAAWIWHPRRGSWLTLYVSDRDSYCVVPVADVGALLLTAGVN